MRRAGRVACVAALWLLVGCEDPLRWDAHVLAPRALGPRTPLVVQGEGAVGQTLLLRSRAGVIVEVALRRPTQKEAGWADGAVGRLPADSGLSPGDTIDAACLAGPLPVWLGDPWRGAAAPVWRGAEAWTAPTIALADDLADDLAAAGALRLGRWIQVAEGAPLPGEATALLTVAVAGPEPRVATLRLAPRFPDRAAFVQVTPEWTCLPGEACEATLDVRLEGLPPGAKGPTIDVAVAAPELDWPSDQPALQRGRRSTFGLADVAPPARVHAAPGAISGLRLGLVGTWSEPGQTTLWPAEQVTATALPLGRSDGRVWLPSASWSPRWAEVEGRGFAGALVWLFRRGEVWLERAARPAASLRLAPTVQRVAIRFDASSRAGLARFGLAAFEGRITTRVLAIVQGHFAGLRVEVGRAGAATDAVEQVQVAVLERDPNGLGLLGNDPSRGKDVGNRLLDEDLGGGLDRAGRAAGQPPYGGVFLASFLALSPTLNPGGLLADPAFDAIFAPHCPALGGTPATQADADAAATEAAIEALAQLIAGTISHEVGHTLGLAAAEGYHHLGDNPGWRMDSGTARPFAERANLPGSGGERWGPVDRAALEATLGPLP